MSETPSPSTAPAAVVWAMGFAAVVAGHLIVLYTPGQAVPQAGFEIPGLDKAIHVVLFAVPTLLAVRRGRSLWWAVPFLVHAPLSEWIQHTFVPLRTGSFGDLLADLAGVALGALLAAWWMRRAVAAPPA